MDAIARPGAGRIEGPGRHRVMSMKRLFFVCFSANIVGVLLLGFLSVLMSRNEALLNGNTLSATIPTCWQTSCGRVRTI